MLDYFNMVAIKENLASFFTEKMGRSHDLGLVRVESGTGKHIKDANLLKDLLGEGDARGPEVSIINVHLDTKMRKRGRDDLDKDNGRQIGPKNAHGVALWGTTGGANPLSREGADLEATLETREEPLQTRDDVSRHLESGGEIKNKPPPNGVEELGDIQADEKEPALVKSNSLFHGETHLNSSLKGIRARASAANMREAPRVVPVPKLTKHTRRENSVRSREDGDGALIGRPLGNVIVFRYKKQRWL